MNYVSIPNIGNSKSSELSVITITILQFDDFTPLDI